MTQSLPDYSEYWPSPLRVKVCGITKADQGVAIAALGAHALGFICVPQSPRFVTPEHIRQITKKLPAQAINGSPLARIGVFAMSDLSSDQEDAWQSAIACIQKTVEMGNLTSVQLHGNESLQFCQQVRTTLPNVELIKAFRIQSKSTLVQAKTYLQIVDGLLLDAYTPQALGGTGETWDWSIVKDFTPPCPWFLAGGLTPENVAQALSQTNPGGIDLSSGVELAPGNKDLTKVKSLFERLASPRF